MDISKELCSKVKGFVVGKTMTLVRYLLAIIFFWNYGLCILDFLVRLIVTITWKRVIKSIKGTWVEEVIDEAQSPYLHSSSKWYMDTPTYRFGLWLMENVRHPDIILYCFVLLMCLFQIWNKSYLARTVYWIRGYEYGEAMRSGSNFRSMKEPPSQGAIVDPALFRSRRVGGFVRVNDVAILENHVLEAAGPNAHLKGQTGVLPVTSLPMIQSRIFPDIKYATLTPTQWATLGVRSAPVVTPGSSSLNVPVSVTGPEGQSTGMLVKAPREGMFYYQGSTVDGYSGCGYYNQVSELVGIHFGVAAFCNAGFSATVMVAEIQMLFRVVDPTQPEARKKKTIASDYEQAATRAFDERLGGARSLVNDAWSEGDLISKISKMSTSKGDWADPDFDYGASLNWGESATVQIIQALNTTNCPALLECIKATCEAREKILSSGLGQDETGTSSVQLPVDPQQQLTRCILSTVKNTVQAELTDIEQRVAGVESNVLELNSRVKCLETSDLGDKVKVLEEKTNKPVRKSDGKAKPFTCEVCTSSFVYVSALKAHQLLAHQMGTLEEVKLAQRKDSGAELKGESKASFLVKRKSRFIKPGWPKTSNISVESSQSTQDPGVLKQILDIQEKMLNILQSKHQDMPGQSLTQEQN